jgi:hypothetical protein
MPVVAVGAIGAVVAALLALLILYGISALARVVGNLAPDWSIPGLGNIRTHIVGAAQAALRGTAHFLDAAAGAAAGWVLAPWHVIRVFMDKVASLANQTYFLGVRLWHYTQHVYNLAIAYAAAKALAGIHFAEHVYNLAIAYAAARALAGIHFAEHVYNLAIAYAAAKALAVTHFAQHVYNAAIAYAAAKALAVTHFAQHVYNVTHAEIADALAIAKHYAGAVALSTATTVVGIFSTDLGKVAAAEWVKITDEVAALEGVIATDLPDIGALARAIPRAVPIELADVLAGGLAVDRLALRYLRECGIPNCKNLGGFGRLLQDLIGAVETGAILVLIEEAARHPEATAHLVDELIGGPVREAAHTFRSLAGV